MSAAGRFGHGVAGIVDKVDVVAAEALHRVDAAAAIDDVGAGIAGDRLAEGIARQVDRRDPGVVRRGEELDLGTRRQRVADRRQDTIGRPPPAASIAMSPALSTKYMSSPPRPCIVSAPPPPSMMLAPALPSDRLAEGVARQVDRARPRRVRRGEELDFGTRRQRVADRGQHTIGAAAGRFDHDVAGIVDIVHVVAAAAHHSVGASGSFNALLPASPVNLSPKLEPARFSTFIRVSPPASPPDPVPD